MQQGITVASYGALVPVAVMCLRDRVGRRVILLATPAAALHWLVWLAGAGPGALAAAETGAALARHAASPTRPPPRAQARPR